MRSANDPRVKIDADVILATVQDGIPPLLDVIKEMIEETKKGETNV